MDSYSHNPNFKHPTLPCLHPHHCSLSFPSWNLPPLIPPPLIPSCLIQRKHYGQLFNPLYATLLPKNWVCLQLLTPIQPKDANPSQRSGEGRILWQLAVRRTSRICPRAMSPWIAKLGRFKLKVHAYQAVGRVQTLADWSQVSERSTSSSLRSLLIWWLRASG